MITVTTQLDVFVIRLGATGRSRIGIISMVPFYTRLVYSPYTITQTPPVLLSGGEGWV